MNLIAMVIRISHATFHCNRLATTQYSILRNTSNITAITIKLIDQSTAITLKIPCTNNWQYDTKWNA